MTDMTVPATDAQDQKEPNRLNRALSRVERLPAFVRKPALGLLVGWNIPFTRAAGVSIENLDTELVRLRLANRRRVRNHIGTVHAAAAALVAETASGLAIAMHLPDDKVPLLKTMAFRYTRRSAGGLVAEAHLSPDQVQELETQERGEVKVPVSVWDDDNEKPLECVIVWAWRTKR